MAKRSNHLGSKNFFTLVVLSVSALAVMTFTFASQQKTSTQSDASIKTETETAENAVRSANALKTAVETANIPKAISEAEKAQAAATALKTATVANNTSKVISEAKKLSEAAENVQSTAMTTNSTKVVALAVATKTVAEAIQAAAEKKENSNTGSGNASDPSHKYPCARKPSLTMNKAVGAPNSVNYKFTIKNRDNSDETNSKCEKDIYKIEVDKPKGFNITYYVNGIQIGDMIGLNEGESKNIDINIKPQNDVDKDTYKIYVNFDHTKNDGPNSEVSKTIYYTKD